MPQFRTQAMAELARELTFAPLTWRRQHVDRAEQLYWQLESDRNYPFDYITFRITGVRSDTAETTTLVGKAIQHDLLRLVEQVSETINEPVEVYSPSPWDLRTICTRMKVTSKTISRYRRQGLFARRLIWPGGRKKLSFLPESVERFKQVRTPRQEQAAGFTRIDEPTQHEIIVRARRIASRVDASPFRVARYLSDKYGRSTEAVRQLLLRHDERDPRVAIFPDHTPPLTEREQRIIHRAYHRGVPVAKMAERYNRARNAIYRALNLRRAAALRELNLRYVTTPTFELPDAEQVLLGPPIPAPPPPVSIDPQPGRPRTDPMADGLTSYIQQLYQQPLLEPEPEKVLFVRYNFLKYLADQMRAALDPYHPRSRDLDVIETHLRRAVSLKEHLVRANLRLVVSVARKHLSGGRGFRPQLLSELIAEGNLVLVEAIESFDPARGNRFSTYLSWALMRRFAQASKQSAPSRPIAATSDRREYWPAELDPEQTHTEHAEHVTHTLDRLLGELDERERFIITRHFGLTTEDGYHAEPQTLAQVAAELDISAERARQIEHRAMGKLRQAAAELGLDMPVADALSRA
ncbi:MAG: sigma-70 family RNA polymerase sigma factor [Phycisphaera sp.]|nr:sigma-70 family RNA polymerase sigma factor [Phycisphaera sp.]